MKLNFKNKKLNIQGTLTFVHLSYKNVKNKTKQHNFKLYIHKYITMKKHNN